MSDARRDHPGELELQAYFDGELPATQRSQVEAHLQGCPACGAQVRRMEVVAAALATLEEQPAEIELRIEVLKALPGGRRSSLPGVLLAQLLVAALVAGVAAPSWLRFLHGLRVPWDAFLLQQWGRSIWETLLQVGRNLQSYMPDLALPGGPGRVFSWGLLQLTAVQLALGIGLALVLWLFMNRVLLSGFWDNGQRGARAG